MNLEEALAREGIRDTLSRYNLSGDRGRLDEVIACFTEDGVLEIDGEPPHRGREAIERRLRGAADEFGASGSGGDPFSPLRHHLTTSGIELLAPDEARAWSYFLVVTDIGPDHTGRYIDDLCREGDRWCLTRRRVRLDWRSPQTRFASTLELREGT